MESICIADDWSVELDTPDCELKWDGCTGKGVAAFRVHGCAFYFTCDSCRDTVKRRIFRNFRRFRHMKCRSCGLEFSQSTYYQMFAL